MYQIKKFVTSFFKVYPNRHLYLHTFLRKTPWKLYDPFITFRLQMWTINYMHISKSFSVCLWNIFENITGMPLRGHLLAARNMILACIEKFLETLEVKKVPKIELFEAFAHAFGHVSFCKNLSTFRFWSIKSPQNVPESFWSKWKIALSLKNISDTYKSFQKCTKTFSEPFSKKVFFRKSFCWSEK